MSPLAVSKQLVEQVAEPSLKDGDLGFSNRHVFRPVIRHRPCHRSALRSSPARTRGRHCIVVEIVALRVGRYAPLRFLRASHGAIVASLADPLNSRSARHITLRCSDLALRLPRERNRAEQAMIAWQQRAGPSERSQGRKPAEPGARSASLDGVALVRQRSPMRSWRASIPSLRNTTLRCERWRSER